MGIRARTHKTMLCHESIEDIDQAANRYQSVLTHAPLKPQPVRPDDVAEPPRKARRTIKPAMNYNASSDEDLGAIAAVEDRAIIISDEDEETRRVTVWNPKTGKKLSGNAGVFKKNLSKYLRTHPDWVVWTGQDKSPRRRRSKGISSANARSACSANRWKRSASKWIMSTEWVIPCQLRLPCGALSWRCARRKQFSRRWNARATQKTRRKTRGTCDVYHQWHTGHSRQSSHILG